MSKPFSDRPALAGFIIAMVVITTIAVWVALTFELYWLPVLMIAKGRGPGA